MGIGLRSMRQGAVGAFLLAVLLAAPHAGARQTSANLIRNGDGEADAAATAETQVVSPSGWQTTATFTVARYGSYGLPDAPAGGGSNLFTGGSGSPLSTATQTLDVSGSAAAIDSEAVRATLSALLGGWEEQEDSATVRASFLDSSGATVGSLVVGPVTAADRGGKSVLLPRSTTGAVPLGTRSIRVVITSQRASGIYNDGYADNVTLSLSSGTPTVGRYAFGLRVFDRKSDLSTGTSGTFVTRGQPNADHQLMVVRVAAKDLTLSWRYRGGRYRVVLGFRGTGFYSVDSSYLWLQLSVKRSTVPSCRTSSAGSLALNRPGDVTLRFCRNRIVFMAPDRASGWVEQR